MKAAIIVAFLKCCAPGNNIKVDKYLFNYVDHAMREPPRQNTRAEKPDLARSSLMRESGQTG